MEQKTKGIK